MLPIIAWRNVWRNKLRSSIVIGAIVLGIWAVLFVMGFINSFAEDFIRNSIQSDISHIQVHHPGFKDNREIQYTIPGGYELWERIRGMEEVEASSGRINVNGMISTTTTSSGVQLMGVDTGAEARITRLRQNVSSGEYFTGVKRNPILLGKKLAEKLQAKTGNKVVINLQDLEGNITAASFRVAGIVDTRSTMVNQTYAYVPMETIEPIIGAEGQIHEIAILLKDEEKMEQVIRAVNGMHAEVVVEGWNKLAPELDLMRSQMSVSMTIVLTIIMIALAFGIVNTMLMAVLERVREIGMLMAVGMNRLRVFFMVMLETLMIAAIGAPAGMLFGFLTMLYLGHQGVDLSGFSEGLEKFGYSNIFYPNVKPGNYGMVAAGVAITALVGAIYPAWKAIKLKPVEAIRKL